VTARPNILFLMSDEHRADVAGFAGDPVVRTPVLDELARTGTVFRNAYTPSPICIPGRQCMMSGQLPETCGCRRYGEDLPPGTMTFARRLAQYAYHTTCAGKLHHVGQDQMQGWTTRVAPDAEIYPPYIEGRVESEFARYAQERGTGKRTNQVEIERAGIGEGPPQQRDRRALEAALDYVDHYFADPWYDRPQAPRPLLLKLSLLQPHYPFFTDAAKFAYYLNRVPLYLEERSDHPVLSRTQAGAPVNATPRDVRRATAAYYGMVESVDTAYGRLMERLSYLGQDLDDWIIVYTTDHGELLGQHGIWEKTQFYQGSVRVPLIIRWPKHLACGDVVPVIDENVNLCDLFATLCDFAGVPVPPGLDSRSLVPLLRGGLPRPRGEGEGWRNESISQYGSDRVMIKQDHLKYQYYGEGAPEVLFDLVQDPGESTNVAADGAYAADLFRFRERLAALGHGPDADSNYINAGYV
jgi:choline-sulfatase